MPDNPVYISSDSDVSVVVFPFGVEKFATERRAEVISVEDGEVFYFSTETKKWEQVEDIAPTLNKPKLTPVS